MNLSCIKDALEMEMLKLCPPLLFNLALGDFLGTQANSARQVVVHQLVCQRANQRAGCHL